MTTTLHGQARDRFLTLLEIYDLHTAPVHELGDSARLQGHPAIAELKARLEGEWLQSLEAEWEGVRDDLEDDVVEAMKTIAIRDRIPAAYRWLADTADWPQVVAAQEPARADDHAKIHAEGLALQAGTRVRERR